MNEACIAKLQSFGDFKEDWDGYGGVPFDQEYLHRVEVMLRDLPDGAEVFPSGDGTVQIEFQNSKGAYLGIELCEDGRAVFFEVDLHHGEEGLPHPRVGCADRRLFQVQIGWRRLRQLPGAWKIYGLRQKRIVREDAHLLEEDREKTSSIMDMILQKDVFRTES